MGQIFPLGGAANRGRAKMYSVVV